MNTEYRKTAYTPLQKQMALNYYEQNLYKKVLANGGSKIYYENHCDWREWGLFQEFEAIRQMDFDEAVKYIIEWLETRDKTFYSTPRYTQMLNSIIENIED